METTNHDLIAEHNRTAKNVLDFTWNHPDLKSKPFRERVLIFLVVCVLLPTKIIKDTIQNFRKK